MRGLLDTLSSAVVAMPAFDTPKKETIIRLRWMVIIVCCYLLLFSNHALLPQNFIHGFALVYLLSNVLLYFVDPKRFSSFEFFSPLVLFDTFALSFSLIVTGQLGSDLYLTYFLIIIIAGFWRDFRWSLAFATLISLLYSYLLLISDHFDTSVILRVPFLFSASVFYGYFAQVVTSERSLREEAENEARRDCLTSLPNRKAFEERINDEIERARRYETPLSLLIVDIDNFKIVNDSLGHQWGDIVLQRIAVLFNKSVRRTDFVARLGGDEFVVILPETDRAGATEVAERIRSEVKQQVFETPKGLCTMTVSIGISSDQIGDNSDRARIINADQALYLAKQRGRDQVAALPTISQQLTPGLLS